MDLLHLINTEIKKDQKSKQRTGKSKRRPHKPTETLSVGNVTINQVKQSNSGLAFRIDKSNIVASKTPKTLVEYGRHVITVEQSSRQLLIGIHSKKRPYEVMNMYWEKIVQIVANGYKNPTELVLFGKNNRHKEILETSSAIHHLTEYFTLDFKKEKESKTNPKHVAHSMGKMTDNAKIRVICVGDGIGPAVGYLLAATTKWHVVSVDPLMRDEWLTQTLVPNLTCLKEKMEDVKLGAGTYDFDIIVAVHSHANLDFLWRRLLTHSQRVVALSIPCCSGYVQHVMDLTPVYEHQEDQIPSSSNQVLIWDSNQYTSITNTD